MPTPSHRRPNSNILDLRKIIAERDVATRRRRAPALLEKFRLSGQPTEAWHDPAPMQRDWAVFRREVVKFVVVAVAIAIPVLIVAGMLSMAHAAGRVQALARDGLTSLQTGSQALGQLKTDEARQAFEQSQEYFQSAEQQVQRVARVPLTWWRPVPWLGPRLISAQALTQAGVSLSEAGLIVTKVIAQDPPEEPTPVIETGEVIRGSLGFITPMFRHPESFKAALEKLERVRERLSEVSPQALPPESRDVFRAWQLAEGSIIGEPERFQNLADLLIGLFAQTRPQEYLIIFQNHDELRATGGFMGTFLLVKFDRGTFTVLDAPGNGPFDLTSQIPHTSLPPEPILAVAPYWTFHDANWFLDVPTSADFLMDFYEQARGFRPDGVIWVAPQVVEDILAITGPLQPAGYGISISRDNFVRATELQVEFGFDKALNNPKEFLLDLVPTLINKMKTLPTSQGVQTLASVLTNAVEQNLLITSRAPELQATIQDLGWSGQLIETPDDFLAVVDSNLGGGKTDRVIKTNYAVTVQPTGNGLEHTLVISRRHQGQTDDPLSGQTNRDFIRVYVPSDADLISIDGASPPSEITIQPAEVSAKTVPKLRQTEGDILVDEEHGYRFTRESGRRVFGFWSVIGVGQEQSITVRYRLPLQVGQKAWRFIWQKQPGTTQRTWQVVYRDQDQTLKNTYPQPQKQGAHEVQWESNSDLSRSFSLEW